MKKCGSCFRFVEDWRDAKAKGLEPRYTRHAEYSYSQCVFCGQRFWREGDS